ncbi:MAG TPA: monofunctional biosynthetic peptidoglycan transglycosylase [Vicinamibacterales bacterium]|nr:monofunctional biosynthetic peptidoglycan transglycosylase [Vicinamibacterales bacterium]
MKAGRAVLRGLGALAALVFAFFAYVYLTLPDVRVLAATNPKTTAFRELRERDAAQQGKPLRHYQVWVPYARISQNLKRAVLVAEDDAFWQHEGVDMEQLKISIRNDIEKGQAIRGGSTITQQLAKNLYLSPSRDPIRKLRELIIARRLEAELSKARIFEIYLNVIEWGDGIWGAEAAARSYFGSSAASLSAEQGALLAGAIINPRVYSPAHPNARLLRRQRIILSRMGGYVPPTAVPVVNNEPQPSDGTTGEAAAPPPTDAAEPAAEPEPALPAPQSQPVEPADPTPPPQQ